MEGQLDFDLSGDIPHSYPQTFQTNMDILCVLNSNYFECLMNKSVLFYYKFCCCCDIFNNIVACLNVSLYPYDNWKLFERKGPLLGRHSNKETFLTSLGYPSKRPIHLALRMSCYACQLVLRRSCKNICRLQMCPPVFFFCM